MVVGNGLIANEFKDIELDNYIVFASGVSDSSEKEEVKFNREKDMLKFYLDNYNDKTLIYFNSILTESSVDTPYYNHKRDMVELLKKYNNYKLYNVPQIFGRIGNNNNIVNFFISSLKNNKEIYLQKDTYRSIIDVYDLKNIVLETLNYNINQFNISYIELLTVSEILDIISKLYNIDPIKRYINSGIYSNIKNDELIDNIIFKLNIDKNGYTNNVIQKYKK